MAGQDLARLIAADPEQILIRGAATEI